MAMAEKPPVLTVHEDSGSYVIWTGDNRFRSLIPGLAKLLPKAERLIVITPSGTKFFTGDGAAASQSDATPDHSSVAASADDPLPPAEVIAEQESHALPSQDEEPLVESQPPKARRRKPLNSTPKAGRVEPCQRCAGKGTITTMMPNGTPAESGCPVCSGAGTMKRFGGMR